MHFWGFFVGNTELHLVQKLHLAPFTFLLDDFHLPRGSKTFAMTPFVHTSNP